MNDNCAVFVSSCDKYEDTWQPFFKLLNKYWSDCPYQIYLNTETKNYNNHKIKTINSHSPNETWSKRFYDALSSIKKEYIIFLLDDFFLYETVDQDEINNCIEYMDNNSHISCFSFEKTNYKNLDLIPSNLYNKYSQRGLNGDFWVNCQACLWRRKDLLRLINEHENIWQFEAFGTNRAKMLNKEFYILNSCEKSVFNYYWHVDDQIGLCKGKWMQKTPEFFAKKKIDVNFYNLGFFDGDNSLAKVSNAKKNLFEKMLFFIYGTDECYHMSIKEQLWLLIRHPRSFLLNTLKAKLKFLFNNNFRI